MGIGPITNITPLTIAQPIGSDYELTPMSRVENSTRNGDETYSPSGGKQARGSEDDGSEDEFEELACEDAEAPPVAPARKDPNRQISFFV
jgi:hypothetical protein